MKKYIPIITALSLFAAAIVALPAVTRAQEATPPGAPEQKSEAPAKHKKHDTVPFHGKVSAIDTKAMTLTIGKRTFDISSETKITKDGKPATLADGVVGEMVGGAYKKGVDGKLTATTIHFDAKFKGEKKHKNKSDSDTDGSADSVPN